jgi:hypothetical protein
MKKDFADKEIGLVVHTIILATQEAVIRRILVGSQPRQII